MELVGGLRTGLLEIQGKFRNFARPFCSFQRAVARPGDAKQHRRGGGDRGTDIELGTLTSNFERGEATANGPLVNANGFFFSSVLLLVLVLHPIGDEDEDEEEEENEEDLAPTRGKARFLFHPFSSLRFAFFKPLCWRDGHEAGNFPEIFIKLDSRSFRPGFRGQGSVAIMNIMLSAEGEGLKDMPGLGQLETRLLKQRGNLLGAASDREQGECTAGEGVENIHHHGAGNAQENFARRGRLDQGAGCGSVLGVLAGQKAKQDIGIRQKNSRMPHGRPFLTRARRVHLAPE